jgi:RimJ/RimL family protein N-acetyltransferase
MESMMRITNITNLLPVYAYQMGLQVPYFIQTDFENWKESFEHDVDGEGRLLFRQLHGKAAYDGDTLIGFIQYGNTAFGFDDCGEISQEVSYSVIRSLYFDKGREDAGKLLLEAALSEFKAAGQVYAFFHYFGMSCFARHGKLFERFDWIKELLHRYGFVVEHENVYYSTEVRDVAGSEVELMAHDRTAGHQQMFDFFLDGKQVGGCEVHDLPTEGTVFLRWIYVNGEIQNQGVGSKCMAALKGYLYEKGMTRLDTDTALGNLIAQRYYEKNGFTREGITRSYYWIK